MPLWNREIVSVSSWLDIASTEISQGRPGRNLKTAELMLWLMEKSRIGDSSSAKRVQSWVLENSQLSSSASRYSPVASSTFSKMRSILDCRRSVEGIQSDILEVIIHNVSLQSCSRYFEYRAYEAMKFFMATGGTYSSQVNRPLGAYASVRPSFRLKNRFICSAFVFYENDPRDERLFGYGVHGQERILRFKELRDISFDEVDTPQEPYRLISNGIVFNNRQCFILLGASFEFAGQKPEKELRPDDIEHVQFVYYVLDDDNNNRLIRGFKPTILRVDGKPVCPIVEFTWKGHETSSDIEEVAKRHKIDVGVINVDELPAEYINRFQGQSLPDYNMASTSIR